MAIDGMRSAEVNKKTTINDGASSPVCYGPAAKVPGNIRTEKKKRIFSAISRLKTWTQQMRNNRVPTAQVSEEKY